MDTVYIETSVVSHATAWPSKNPAIAVLQAQAKQWLETEAPKFRLVTSQFVIDEASRGDPDAAKRRLATLENVALLLPDPDVESLADKIVAGCMMPQNARLDALHVASAVLAGGRLLVDTKLSPHRERNRTSETLSSTGRNATTANFGLHSNSIPGRPRE